MKNIFNILKVLAGIGILIYIYSTIGVNNIITEISKLNPILLIPILFILIVSFLIASLNIKLLITVLNKHIRLSKILKMYLVSWSFGLIVPGKIGELSIVPMLEKEGLSIGEGFAISILDKMITVFVLSIVSICGLLLIFNLDNTNYIILALILITILPILLIASKNVRYLIRKKVLRKYEKKFVGFSQVFFRVIKNKYSLVNIILTLIKWFLSATTLWIFFLSLNSFPSLLDVFFISAITTIISLIPITISGLGIREGTAVYLFSLINIESPVVVSVYFLFVTLNYLIAGLVLLFLKIDKRKVV